MTASAQHHATNDARFVPFPLHRPQAKLFLTGRSETPPPPFDFMIATDSADLESAAGLVGRCYGWRGYSVANPESGVGETTLIARRDHRVVGTITVRCGVRVRLHAEIGFAEHVGELRRQGCRLVEYTRFAIDRDAVASSAGDTDLAAELIRRALLLGRIALDATDCVIEVNPRHVRYYQRQFGFRPFGQERTCERVGAPARLLHLDMNRARPAGSGAQTTPVGHMMQ
jgi:hypothetical protein